MTLTVSATELEARFIKLYTKLNLAQKEAVDQVVGPVMVLAGPGTGKTQILAMRIANILRNPDLQASPANILCLTFTESAVTAMRNRLIEIIGSEAYYVRIHTFHSFCNDIIKENPEKFLTINPISELEKIQLFNEIIDSLDPTSPIKPFGEPYLYRSDLINLIQTLKRESISATKLLEATDHIEQFLKKNKDLIEDFISRHARTIKDADCDSFIEKLYVANQDSGFVSLIQDYRDHSERIAEFKNAVKDFYEKNLKEVPKQKELAKVYKAYQERLTTKKLYDFEDMILRVINQFKNDNDLLARYQEQYQFILVDEYQDTNGAQNQIIEFLTSDPLTRINSQDNLEPQQDANIFVVGDDDQSIYRFQGASVENIIYFYKRYQANLKLVVLGQNYRSQQTILDVAHSGIDANEARVSKLIPSITKLLNSAGEASSYDLAKVELIKSVTIDDEIYHIAKAIQKLLKQGVSASEVAVLFRENKEALPLVDTLARMGIRARIEAGDNILEDLDIAQLIDLLRVISKPESYSSLIFNLLNYNFILESEDFSEIGIREVFDLNRAKLQAGEKKPLIEVLLDHPKFSAWANKILKLKQESYNYKFDNLLEKVIKDFGYIDYILKQPNYVVRINRLDSLFKEVRSFMESPLRLGFKYDTAKNFTIDDFISHIELLQENKLKIKAQGLKVEAEAVRLMTAHKSKGLEFEYVFIHSCRDKHWGNKPSRSKIKLPPKLIQETQSILKDDSNEDDRRLFYVAMTRAKKKLYLSYHIKNDNGQDIVPSLFVSEIANHQGVGLIDYTEQSVLTSDEAEKLTLKFTPRDDFAISQEAEYINSLLKDYKLSVTHLNNYLECPRKFFYQNLLRVPSAKNKHACFGTAVHEALFDLFVLMKTQETHNNGLELLLERFEHHLKEENLPEQEYNDSLGVGKKALTEYYEHYKDQFITRTELEYDFSSKGINLNGVILTGKLDKIEITDPVTKAVNVVDYKTGNPNSKAQDLNPGGDYHRQIVFYQLLCDQGHKSGQFPYTMQSGEIDFIQPGYGNKFIKRKINVASEDLDRLKEEIELMYAAVQEHKFGKTEDLDSCARCSFKNICGR